MRTTLDLDDELMLRLMERYPGVSKTEAVEQAIREHLAQNALERLEALRGRIEIEDCSRELRRIDRRA